MKKYTLILLLAIIGLQGISQTASKKTIAYPKADVVKKQIDSICKLIVIYTNQKATDKLYALTGGTFRKTMNYESFKGSAESHLYPLNGILKTELLEHKSGLSIYKVSFKDLSFLLNLSIDNKKKLVSFLWRPNPNQ